MIDVNLSDLDAKILATVLDWMYWNSSRDWHHREKEVMRVTANQIKESLETQSLTSKVKTE